MSTLRTEITEVVTGLAMFGYPDLDHAIAVQPPAFRNVAAETYARLHEARSEGIETRLFEKAWANGVAFARSDEALRGRTPWMIEWKGAHRPPGYDRIPADLRIDHVFLVSCKYGSNILLNSSPSNLFDRLLADRRDETTDWFHEVAPISYQRLYDRCRSLVGGSLPGRVEDLDRSHRQLLKRELPRRFRDQAQADYLDLVHDVGANTAARWRSRMGTPQSAEAMVWRLLRLESAPYFVLGESTEGHSIGYRVVTPGDLRRTHRFVDLHVAADTGRGQPVIEWVAAFIDRDSGLREIVRGHIEIRWSHGKFAQVPEAKVYLRTPHHDVPGYVALQRTEVSDPQQSLFTISPGVDPTTQN